MKQKSISLIPLLTSALLLFSFSSLFADVTVTYNDDAFPYNTSGNVVQVTVTTTDDIAAFDLIGKVRSTVTDAFGAIDDIRLVGAATDQHDILAAGGSPEEQMFRAWGFDCAVPVQLTAAGSPYTFEIELTTNCEIGEFVVEDGGDWVVDPVIPVIANTMFVTAGAVAATVTVTTGTYTVYNTAPVITNCPTAAWVYNACAVITYDFDFDDPDITCLTDPVWSIVSGPGQINSSTGAYSWDPVEQVGMCHCYPLLVQITDEWGDFDTCRVDICLITDAPIFTDCPTAASETFIYWGWTADGQVIAVDPDVCPLPLEYTLISFSGPGTFNLNTANGVWSWATIFGDDAYLGDFNVQISVFDGCEYDYCDFVIHVAPTFEVLIEKVHDQLQGHYAWVDIELLHWTEGFGGYDFLIAYDASALSFLLAEPGDILTTCGFEYFTYRFGADGNCGSACPSGFLRVVAIADANNGPNHPLCYGEGLEGTLASLKFYVTNDRTYECQFVPVSFYWFDCGDNGISSISGDTLYISAHVYGYDLVGEITGVTGYGGWQGTEYDCMEGDKITPDTVINFFNGGVDIVCADSIDRKGDLNLNGIANEIADAVVYTNYFLFGVIALDIQYEAQVAASDVNNDGTPLSVGDLVYLIRIITGDALPFPKLAPFSATADIHVVNGMVSSSASDNVGAVYMTFNVNGDYEVVTHTDMEVVYAESEGILNVLIYSGLENMTNAIPAGNNELVTVTGAELASVTISDYNGNLMNVRVEKTALPTDFALEQNVPNPFNPATRIGFDLPVVSDWKLDIYNVNGQLIQSYNGTNLGHVEVTWDATNVASGVYFYKLAASSFTATKKMVLMK